MLEQSSTSVSIQIWSHTRRVAETGASEFSAQSHSLGMVAQQIKSMALTQQHLPTCRSFAPRPFISLSKSQLQKHAHKAPRITYCHSADRQQHTAGSRTPVLASTAALWLISGLPAYAEGTDFSQGSFSKESYYVTLGLFLLSLPGMACCAL